MGIADTFAKEDRVDVKFSDFAGLMKGVVRGELLMNAVRCNVPHRYIREMATGISEEEGLLDGETRNH